MEIKIVMKYPFDKFKIKDIGVTTFNNYNGLYVYDRDEVYINVGSEDFSFCKDENKITELFNKVMTHELLHKEIFNITRKVSTDAEEFIVLLMAEQVPWRK